MEELGVLIPLAHRTMFATLPPMRTLPANGRGKSQAGIAAESTLICGKSTVFFQEVKQVNNETTIIIKSGNEPALFFPKPWQQT